MARPHSEGLEYFEHDVDASNDEKIESMEALYGAAGYAFYFKMAERIYRAGGSLLVSAAETRQILARKCLCTVEEWTKMLATALRIELFDALIYEKEFVLTSNGIQKRCRKVFDKRKKMANRYHNRVSDAETPPETPPVEESRVEESRGKQRRVKNVLAHVDPSHLPPAQPDPSNIAETRKLLRQFSPPSREEVSAYCRDRGKGVNPDKWWDFYAGKGWMVGKNKMKDWQAACRTWENEDGKNTGAGQRGTLGAAGKVTSGAGERRAARSDGEYPEDLQL